MKKKPTSPERDWLHVGSRSVTTSGFHAPPGPISEPLGMTVRKANLLSDYGDEASCRGGSNRRRAVVTLSRRSRKKMRNKPIDYASRVERAPPCGEDE